MTNNQLLEMFDKLTEYTYIYGYEDELMSIINPILPKPLTRDEYGNYFIKIGDSNTLFCSHLDTVGNQKLKINKEYYEEKGHRFVKTDGNTILGADDKTGMVIMLNMIDNDIPGMYYFLIGEEKGTVGSGLLYSRKSKMILSKYDRCIAFDRRGYGSIINRQMGKYCCSDEFVTSLAAELANAGMRFKKDSTGVWTDSALFMGVIPECTNLSVGYFNEHQKTEHQDLDYMVMLSNAVVKVNWENLPVVREPQPFDTEDPDDYEEIPENLPLRKLMEIFDEVEGIIYDVSHQFAGNSNFFKPEKEMTFFSIKDLSGTTNFSVYIHLDGSITFKKGDIETDFQDIDMLRVIYEKKFVPEILTFQDGFSFKYQMKNGRKEIVIDNIKKSRIKKFKNFK